MGLLLLRESVRPPRAASNRFQYSPSNFLQDKPPHQKSLALPPASALTTLHTGEPSIFPDTFLSHTRLRSPSLVQFAPRWSSSHLPGSLGFGPPGSSVIPYNHSSSQMLCMAGWHSMCAFAPTIFTSSWSGCWQFTLLCSYSIERITLQRNVYFAIHLFIDMYISVSI